MRLWVTDTVVYGDSDFKEVELVKDETYIFEYPRTLFVSLQSDSSPLPGHFNLMYRYIDRDPNLIKTPLHLAAQTESPVTPDDSFFLIIWSITGLLLFLLLILSLLTAILACCKHLLTEFHHLRHYNVVITKDTTQNPIKAKSPQRYPVLHEEEALPTIPN
jgi:hypothetical protein